MPGAPEHPPESVPPAAPAPRASSLPAANPGHPASAAAAGEAGWEEIGPPLPLSVGFDGRDLLRKRTGVVNYAVQLAQLLHARPGSAFRVYADAFQDPAVTAPPDVPLTRLRAPPVAWKHLALPLALLRHRIDLFHSPTGTLPLWAPCPQVVTIHDLFAELHPEWFPRRVAEQLSLAQRRAAHVATALITVSEKTRRLVLERYAVSETRVMVVHNGVDHERFRPGRVATDDQVLRRLGVQAPYVLCVGSLMPWRNAPTLLRAVARLRTERGVPHHLLFVGRDIWGTDPTTTLIREQGWSDWAHIGGYVDDDELPGLYAGAEVLAAPSLDEGFGIPVLEAMASGTPVVASTAGALPEVVGDAALLVDPLDQAGLADALWQVISNGGLRERLRSRGLARAQALSWQRAAAETWRVYEASLEVRS